MARNMKRREPIRCALAAKVMSYEADIRERGVTSGKCVTFITHYPLFLLFHPLSLCSASHEAKEPFCVNSLIRETLTCGSRPLFLFILVGKYFIDFCSNRRRAELRGALTGIRLCGGFLGWVGNLWGGVWVCVDGASDVPPHNPYPFSASERTNYSCDPWTIITHLFLSSFTPYLQYFCTPSFLTYSSDKRSSFTNIWMWQGFCLCSPERKL